MKRKAVKLALCALLALNLSGCLLVSAATTAVGVAVDVGTTVVGTAVDVVM